MKKSTSIFTLLIILFSGLSLMAQTPSPALVGYWHNWNIWGAPYIQLDQVDSRYNVVDVSFAEPVSGTDYKMAFTPSQVTQATFITQVQTLQNQGRKVIISIGGANAPVHLNNTLQRDTFITTMGNIINTYGFDGMDIDLEGSSLSLTGGTISTPTDAKIINLIYAVKKIMENYYLANNKKLILTAAPETAFVQGGQSAFGGIWGAYLPFLDAVRDSMDILHVQLYNSGSMFGVDNNIYTQGTADFIVAMAEAVIVGFNTTGGSFMGYPANKVAVGLPACASAAGGGYTDTNTVIAAMNYLLGQGPKPGSYTLVNAGGYPNLKGMMTWSVNWDAASGCNGAHQYANTFSTIFTNIPLSVRFGEIGTSYLNKKIHIKWTTRTEVNTDYFNIQKSTDGVNFKNIDSKSTKAENGNSNNEISYLSHDTNPVSGLNYYRIEQVSIDGVSTFSEVVSEFINTPKEKVVIYPNPADKLLMIDITNNLSQKTTVTVNDLTGRVVRTEVFQLRKGLNQLMLSIDGLNDGIYSLVIKNNERSFHNQLFYKK